MTDNGLAALAAALHSVNILPFAEEGGEELRFFAAAILGERGVFLPEGHPLGVEEAIAQGQARIAALDARIVDLNAEVLDRMDQWHRDSLARDELARQQNRKIAALRAALDERTVVGKREQNRAIDAEAENERLRAALDGLVAAGEWLSASAPSKPTAFQAKVTASRLGEFRAALAAAKETP